MSKSPFTFTELREAFIDLYGDEPAYDPMQPDSKEMANEIWSSLEDWSQREIREYLRDLR